MSGRVTFCIIKEVSGDGWAVRNPALPEFFESFKSRKDAISRGIALARKQYKADLLIFGADGKLETANVYGQSCPAQIGESLRAA